MWVTKAQITRVRGHSPSGNLDCLNCIFMAKKKNIEHSVEETQGLRDFIC